MQVPIGIDCVGIIQSNSEQSITPWCRVKVSPVYHVKPEIFDKFAWSQSEVEACSGEDYIHISQIRQATIALCKRALL